MKTENDGTECIVKLSAHSILPLPHTATPPIRKAIQLVHNQSENPMAQTADSWASVFLPLETETERELIGSCGM